MSVRSFEENLIKGVQRHPYLYNKDALGYRDKRKTEKAWREIAASVRQPVLHCQGRWKTLRNRFVREVNHKMLLDAEYKPTWHHFDDLYFLKDFIASKGTNSDLESFGKVYLVEPFKEKDDVFEAVFKEEFDASPPTCATPQSSQSSENIIADEDYGASTSNMAKCPKLDKTQNAPNGLVGAICKSVEKNMSENKNDIFYQFVESYLSKVDNEAQDRIKLEVINLVAKRVDEVRQSKKNDSQQLSF